MFYLIKICANFSIIIVYVLVNYDHIDLFYKVIILLLTRLWVLNLSARVVFLFAQDNTINVIYEKIK